MIAAWYNHINNQTPAMLETSGGMTKVQRRHSDMGILSRKITGIYKITNLINGKVYIGQSRDIKGRWAQHRFGRSKDHNYYLANAIAKYGIDNFAFEILQQCSIDELNDLERKYITQYGCVKPNGYNLDGGGNQGKEITAESRKRMSLAWLKRPPITDEERRNRSVAHFKPVSQYTLDGRYLKTFPSIKDAAKTINMPEGNITNCCKGKNHQRTVGGFQWRYASGDTKNIGPVQDGRRK
jgi:hypothetical protein